MIIYKKGVLCDFYHWTRIYDNILGLESTRIVI